MPVGSVKLQSIKKLGQENRSYDVSDDGTFFNFIWPTVECHETDEILNWMNINNVKLG